MQESVLMSNAIIKAGGSGLFRTSGWLSGVEIEVFIQSVLRKGFLGTDYKLLVNTAFTHTNPVNLAY